MAWCVWLLLGIFSGVFAGIFIVALLSMCRDYNYPE